MHKGSFLGLHKLQLKGKVLWPILFSLVAVTDGDVNKYIYGLVHLSILSFSGALYECSIYLSMGNIKESLKKHYGKPGSKKAKTLIKV